jgi:transposase-like protein
MNVEALRKQLESMLLQLDGVAASVQAAMAQIQPEAERPCDHPEEARLNMSAMGLERWRCRHCGFEYEKIIEPGGGD